ncbi:hypothetical protein MMC24_003450 [Lignoscripta atroalba]|nr:hypothetical protein [Lignoscripta atroalba]
MNQSFIPRFLLPYFLWTPRPTTVLSSEIPPTPKPTHPSISRFWGFIHTHLKWFSYHYYCDWAGIPYDNQIIQLPFGLLLKWSDGTRVDEVLATQVARAAGFPTPKIICYGYHPDTPHAPVSILMTRLPGRELGQIYESLGDEPKKNVLSELKVFLNTMRKWKNPWGNERICSVTGGAIRSVRVPNHLVGPCENEQEFYKYLISVAWAGGYDSRAEFEHALAE